MSFDRSEDEIPLVNCKLQQPFRFNLFNQKYLWNILTLTPFSKKKPFYQVNVNIHHL